MKIEQLNQSKIPIIVFDKKLKQFRGKVLFPKKLERANKILAKSGLPKLKKQEKQPLTTKRSSGLKGQQ